MYQYRVKAIKVIDGDTVDVILDLGFHVTVTLRFRLAGINCPEMNTPAGKGAKAFVEDWFRCRPVETLTALTIRDKTEKYGRYIADFTAADDEQTLTHQIVAAQHAVYKVY